MLGPTDELPTLIADSKPDEVIIAIPSAAGETRQRIVNACRDAGVPVKTLPSVYELIAGDLHLARQLRQVEVEDVLGRDPMQLDLEVIASLPRRRDGRRHRRRRLDRLGALPPDRGRPAGAHPPRRARRELPRRDRARAHVRARLQGRRAGARRREEPGEDPQGLRALPADRRLPCRGVQARAADGGEPARVGPEQPGLDPGGRRRVGRVRRADVRARLDGQGRQPEERPRPDEAALRVDRQRRRAAARHRDPLPGRSLRQRPRLVRERDPALPAPDRAGRARHGDASGT